MIVNCFLGEGLPLKNLVPFKKLLKALEGEEAVVKSKIEIE